MTYKFVGALQGLQHPKAFVMYALLIGIGAGILIEFLRKVIRSNEGYRQFAQGSPAGKVTDFILDAIVLPSPYASSFGGFVELGASLWFGLGGVVTDSLEGFFRWSDRHKPRPAEGEVPSDMSTTSLVGGGLIAGDSLAALAIGIYGLFERCSDYGVCLGAFITSPFVASPACDVLPTPIFFRNGWIDSLRPRNFSMEMFTSRESPCA